MKQITRNALGRSFSIVALGLASLIFGGCCDTHAIVGVVIGSTPPMRDALPPHLVVVCPGEKITVGWRTESATSASLTDFGSVPTSGGYKTFDAPGQTKDYVLSVKGDCDVQDTAKVVVATAGTQFVFSAPIVTASDKRFYWETSLLQQFYSPKVKVTSIKINAPPTIAGWQVRKVDLDGTVRDFTVTAIATTPWSQPIQLAGTWTLIPRDLNEISASAVPPFVELQVTLTCQ